MYFKCSESSACQIVEGSARQLMHTFDVKKRVFYGNTSMEAEISLLMANQTMVTDTFPSSAI
jgi:tRNA G10  N-methylase Trm11